MSDPAEGMRFASALSIAGAAHEAVESVLADINKTMDGRADFVAFFATPHFIHHFAQIHDTLRAAMNATVVIGVSSMAVIGQQREVERGPGLSVIAARLPGVTLNPFTYDQLNWGDDEAAAQSVRDAIWPQALGEATGQSSPAAMIFLADPFSTPMAKVIPTFDAVFPGVPLVGGMASAAHKPGENRLVLAGNETRAGAVGVAIGGKVRIDCTVSQGCRPVGRPFVITKNQRHLVKELGGRNALSVLKETLENLSDEDRTLVETHDLLVGRVINEYKDHFGRGDFLLRSLVGYDPDAGYIAIGDPQVRAGQTIQFHVRDKETAREDFALLLEAQELHGPAAGAMLFSCNGRGSRLFGEPHMDASLVHKALGDVPLAGFFAAGEIGPVGRQNFVHGHTASLAVFRPV